MYTLISHVESNLAFKPKPASHKSQTQTFNFLHLIHWPNSKQDYSIFKCYELIIPNIWPEDNIKKLLFPKQKQTQQPIPYTGI